jgi:hypothetical protein
MPSATATQQRPTPRQLVVELAARSSYRITELLAYALEGHRLGLTVGQAAALLDAAGSPAEASAWLLAKDPAELARLLAPAPPPAPQPWWAV